MLWCSRSRYPIRAVSPRWRLSIVRSFLVRTRATWPGSRHPERWTSTPRAWIAYCPLAASIHDDLQHLCHFRTHHRLASPVASWERLKIGGGTPPYLTAHGWLVVNRGVSGSPTSEPAGRARGLRYSAGVLILDRNDARLIRYRSTEPILRPELPSEREGIVADVVFPTAIDPRTDLGQPDRIDVYYGMADARIGVARLDIPNRSGVSGQY